MSTHRMYEEGLQTLTKYKANKTRYYKALVNLKDFIERELDNFEVNN